MAGDTSEHPNASQTHKILSAADMNSSLGSGVLSLSAPDQKTPQTNGATSIDV